MKVLKKIVISASLFINVMTCMYARQAYGSVDTLRDFFNEVDNILFGVDALDDSVLAVDNVYSKDMESTFLKIQQSARRVQAEALNAMRALKDTSSKRISESLKASQKNMVEEVDSLKGLTAQLDDGILQTQKMSQFSIKEFEKDDSYLVNIALPGYSQDDIKVTISKQDVHAGGKTLLEVEAVTKKDKKEAVDASGKNGKNVRVITSHQMVSTSIINERKRELRYQDGVLNARLILPLFINDESYFMVFKDDVLTLEFKKLGKSEAKKELKFSK